MSKSVTQPPVASDGGGALPESAPTPPQQPSATRSPQPGARIANAKAKRSRLTILSPLSIVAVLVAWYVLTDATGAIDPLYFPSMAQVKDSVSQLGTGVLDAAWATTWRVLLSWSIGCALGTAAGLVMGRSRVVFYIANPLIEALRPIPPIALIPFIILWFGLGEPGRILIGAMSCFMIMVVTTHVAIRNVPPVYLQAARSLGAGENRVYRKVVLPAIVPQLVGGVRIAAALTWAVIVAAEYLGAQTGVGYLILQASRTLNTSVVLVGTIVVGILAFVLEQLIRLVADRMTRWVQRSDG